MSKEKIEWALQQEKIRHDHYMVREDLTEQIQGAVNNYLKKVAEMPSDGKYHFMVNRIVDNLKRVEIIPMEVKLDDGKLNEITFGYRPTMNSQHIYLSHRLFKENGKVKLHEFKNGQDSDLNTSSQRVSMLFDEIAKVAKQELSYMTRTFNGQMCSGITHVRKLEDLLFNDNAEEIARISKNIDCYQSIKTLTNDRISPTTREVTYLFDEAVSCIDAKEDPLTARVLIGLHDIGADGEICHLKAMQMVIAEVTNQFDDRMSTEELEKYLRLDEILQVMVLNKGNEREAYSQRKDWIDLNDAAELNSILMLDKKGEGYFKNNQSDYYADWVETVRSAAYLKKWLTMQPGLSPAVFLSDITDKEFTLNSLQGDGTLRYSLGNRGELEKLISLIGDSQYGSEVLRLAKISSVIAYELKNAGNDLTVASRLFMTLPPQDREGVGIVFKSIYNDVEKNKLGAYLKWMNYGELIEKGELPAVAAKKTGIDKSDMSFLVEMYPLLEKIRLDDQENVLGR